MENLHEKMAHACKSYEDIPTPPQLKEKVLEAMYKNEAQINHHPIRWGKLALRTLAAACITIAIGVNVSAEMAEGLAKIPVVGTFVQLITFRNYTHVQDNSFADISIPQVSGLNNEALEKELNQQLKEYGELLITQYETDLKALGDAAYESVESSYQIKTENDRQLTVQIQSLLVQASGQQMNRYYTIDKAAGKLLSLKDLFIKDADYVSLLSDEILKQMRQQMDADDNIVYFIGEEKPIPFSQIKADQQFYVNEQGKLVIAFDEYEVAPGVMGAVEFAFPTEVLSEILTSDSFIK